MNPPARNSLGPPGQGQQLALISDAGTPGISDPGERIVREVIHHGYTVQALPGASAGISALCASGLPTSEFHFLGFPIGKVPAKTETGGLSGTTRTGGL